MERFAAPGCCWCTTCNQRCTLSNEYVYIYIEGHHRAVDVGLL
jgi:heterodisulfide reductase subunit C